MDEEEEEIVEAHDDLFGNDNEESSPEDEPEEKVEGAETETPDTETDPEDDDDAEWFCSNTIFCSMETSRNTICFDTSLVVCNGTFLILLCFYCLQISFC